MKQIYKVIFLLRIFMIVFFLFYLFLGSLFFIFNNEATVFQKFIGLPGALFFMGSIYAVFKFKIIVDDKKIEMSNCNPLLLFLGKRVKHTIKSLNWDDIERLRTTYVLYPEMPIIVLKPKQGVNKKHMEFTMSGISVQLLKDIFFHLSPDTEVYLYPYLKRKLEGKQTWFYNALDEATTAGDIVERIKAADQQKAEGKIKKPTVGNIPRAIITSDSFKEVFGVIAILAIGIVVGMLVIFGIYLVYSKLF